MMTIHFLISGIEKIKAVQNNNNNNNNNNNKIIIIREPDLNIPIFLCRNSDN